MTINRIRKRYKMRSLLLKEGKVFCAKKASHFVTSVYSGYCHKAYCVYPSLKNNIQGCMKSKSMQLCMVHFKLRRNTAYVDLLSHVILLY